MSPCPLVHPSYLPVQETGVELDVFLPVQGLFGEGELGLEPTWQQKGRAGCSHLASRQQAGAPCAGAGTRLPCSVPDLLRMDSSCRSISTGEPICISRAKRLSGEEPLTCPSWVPAEWQGWGASAPGDPRPYPLGRKLLCQTVEAPVLVCRARSITNTLVSAEPTACRWMPRADWGRYSHGSALSQSHPAPRCHPHVSPHAVNHILPTPTSRIPHWYPQPDPDPAPQVPQALLSGGSHSWRCRGHPRCRWLGRQGRGALSAGVPAPAAAAGWHPPAALPAAWPGCRRSSHTVALPAERPGYLMGQPQLQHPQGQQPPEPGAPLVRQDVILPSTSPPPPAGSS